MLSFACDYLEGAHEKILRRLVETNYEKAPGYSADKYCESAKEKISEKLGVLVQYLREKPQVTITYFKPDHSKNGGEYVDVTGAVKHIDEYRRVVIMKNGDIIYFEDIYDIQGKIFE